MTAFAHDNRWSPGASRATVPEDATVVYSARWIDRGDYVAADVLPDRQGFAYNDQADRNHLSGLLGQYRVSELASTAPRDESWHAIDSPRLAVWMRRAGGYVYVDAWIAAA